MLAEEGLSLERESTQTLIAKLWGERTEELRKLVREKVAQGEPYVCPVSLPASGTACFFHLTPVPARAFGGAIDDVYPFGWVGIRLDLLPAVGVGTADWLEESRHYASSSTASQQLVAPRLPAPNTSEIDNQETA